MFIVNITVNALPGIWYILNKCWLVLAISEPLSWPLLNSQLGHTLCSKYQLLTVSQLVILHYTVLKRMMGNGSMNLHSQ